MTFQTSQPSADKTKTARRKVQLKQHNKATLNLVCIESLQQENAHVVLALGHQNLRSARCCDSTTPITAQRIDLLGHHTLVGYSVADLYWRSVVCIAEQAQDADSNRFGFQMRTLLFGLSCFS